MWGIGALLVLGTLIQLAITGINTLNIVLLIVSVLFLLSSLPFSMKLLRKLGLKGNFSFIVPLILILVYLVAGAIFTPYKEENEIISNYEKAMKLVEKKDYEKAEEVFTVLEEKYPYDDRILLGKALYYMDAKNFDSALRYLKNANGINPYDLNIQYNMALTYYHLGDKDRALEQFEEMVNSNPRLYLPRVYIAIINMQKGEYPAAIYHLNQLRLISPESLDVYYYLGKSHFELMEYSKAKEAYERALMLNPSSEIQNEINNALGKIAIYLGGD